MEELFLYLKLNKKAKLKVIKEFKFIEFISRTEKPMSSRQIIKYVLNNYFLYNLNGEMNIEISIRDRYKYLKH